MLLYVNYLMCVSASVGAGKLKARFESMAKSADEENRKKVEEERARRQASETREREETRQRKQVTILDTGLQYHIFSFIANKLSSCV